MISVHFCVKITCFMYFWKIVLLESIIFFWRSLGSHYPQFLSFYLVHNVKITLFLSFLMLRWFLSLIRIWVLIGVGVFKNKLTLLLFINKENSLVNLKDMTLFWLHLSFIWSLVNNGCIYLFRQPIFHFLNFADMIDWMLVLYCS